MSIHQKKTVQRKALIKTILFFLLIGCACVLVLLWAARAEDSSIAKSIREVIGIAAPASTQVVVEVAPPPPPVVKAAVEPVLESIVVEPPPPIPAITFREICSQRHLWPDTLKLKLSKRVSIRYNGNNYGYMEFASGVSFRVDDLKPNGEIYGRVEGNYLSLSVLETDFEEWFSTNYGERYDLQLEVTDRVFRRSGAPHKLGTAEGDATFWAEMRIWCHQNYDSISLEIGEDSLVFRWLPTEEVPINFQGEAREICRVYLMKRATLGGNENYAACEIRHPVTNELLGSSSIFIPRL